MGENFTRFDSIVSVLLSLSIDDRNTILTIDY
jgi:hypothetical protein